MIQALNYPLSQKEFNSIYAKVPRLTVEVIIKDNNNFICLVRRAIQPCKGQWHLPGGTVQFAESLMNAVKRIAERELGIKVIRATNVGYIEYPSHYKNGLDCPVGLVFEVLEYKGSLKLNNESSDIGWFNKVPQSMHADQDDFLLRNRYLS